MRELYNPVRLGVQRLRAVLYLHDHAAHVAWIGEGPVFHIRGDAVEQKTRPHLLVDDAIAAGHLTPEQAKDWPHRNAISRVLGGHAPNEAPRSAPETSGPFDLRRGDLFVLCYRRVASTLEVARLPRLLAGAPPEVAVAKLLDAAEQGPEIAAIVIAAS
jgi:serine/threonine protein phosphatase PrpC